MGLPQEITLPLVQNQDFSNSYGFGVQPSQAQVQAGASVYNSTPYPISGSQVVKATIRAAADSTLPTLLDFSNGVTLAAGTMGGISVTIMSIAITSTQIDTLPVGELYYDVLVTDGGYKTYWMCGPAQVAPTGTR